MFVAMVACAAPETTPTTTVPPTASAPTSTGTTGTGVGNYEIAVEPNPQLRQELLEMMLEDQALRTGVAPPGDDRAADSRIPHPTRCSNVR